MATPSELDNNEAKKHDPKPNTQSASTNKKISTYLNMIVLIVMALAITALLIAVETYIAGDQLAQAS